MREILRIFHDLTGSLPRTFGLSMNNTNRLNYPTSWCAFTPYTMMSNMDPLKHGCLWNDGTDCSDERDERR